MILAGESSFNKLLDEWFPVEGNMPSGFLVNTSEEALLLPDWLKLRMIRCHTTRLVDAGLVSWLIVLLDLILRLPHCCLPP